MNDAAPSNRRARCVRCNEPRERGTPVTHPTRQVYTCGRCGYLNVVASQPEALRVPESLAIAGAQALRQRILDASGADAAAGTALFHETVATLARAALALIDGAPAYALGNAAHALHLSEQELGKHGGQPQGNDLARTGYAKASALMFALATRHGVPDLDAAHEPTTAAEEALRTSFWPVATDAAAAGSILHRVLRGDARVRIANGVFAVELTELGLDTDELAFNRRAAGPNDSYGDEQIQALRDALVAWRNLDLKRLTALVFDETGKRREGLVSAPKDALKPATRDVLDAFELTTDRVRWFDDAWFLDLGPKRATPASDAALALSLVTRNWRAYYPVCTVRRGDRPLYLFGYYGVEIAADNLMATKNRVLQDVTANVPAGVPAATRAKLRDIRVGLNRHAEAQAHGVLASDGWRATYGENWNVGGTTEEIDILAARVRPSQIDVLVGEVKDFDFALHRIKGPAGLDSRIRDAEAQLLRKEARVVQSLASVLQRLGAAANGRPVHVHALLITPDAPPPGMLTSVDGADFPTLARFSRLLDNDRDLAQRLFGRATRVVA